MRSFVDNLEEALAGALMLAILTIIFLSVIFRYVFSQPFQWSDEIAMGLFIWQVFIASAIAAKRGMRIAVEVLVVLLPKAFQRLVTIVAYLLMILVLISIVIFGWQYANSTWTEYTLNLQIPRFWINLSAPVGALLMLRWTIVHLLKVLSGQEIAQEAAGI